MTNIKKDRIYKLTSDIEVLVLTHYFAPFTGGASGVMLKGEKIIILYDPPLTASLVCCKPLRYEQFEEEFISEEERKHSSYSNYSILIAKDIIAQSANE